LNKDGCEESHQTGGSDLDLEIRKPELRAFTEEPLQGWVLEVFDAGPDREYDPEEENAVANCRKEDFRPSSTGFRWSIFDQFFQSLRGWTGRVTISDIGES
jgi:hypothetical protein